MSSRRRAGLGIGRTLVDQTRPFCARQWLSRGCACGPSRSWSARRSTPARGSSGRERAAPQFRQRPHRRVLGARALAHIPAHVHDIGQRQPASWSRITLEKYATPVRSLERRDMRGDVDVVQRPERAVLGSGSTSKTSRLAALSVPSPSARTMSASLSGARPGRVDHHRPAFEAAAPQLAERLVIEDAVRLRRQRQQVDENSVPARNASSCSARRTSRRRRSPWRPAPAAEPVAEPSGARSASCPNCPAP